MDSDNVFKILDEKLKSRNEAEHPLYPIYERILDIEKELKKSNANEELTESNIQIVKNQIDTINSNLKNIKTQNKQSIPNKNESSTVKRYL
jgi:cob(I)alamin adenosyltransferase